MKTIHLKSPCCRVKIHKIGERRRRCSLCHKTWSIRKRKQGRRVVRVHPDVNRTVIERKESLRLKASRTRRGRETVRRRHERNMEGLLKSLPQPESPKGDLIAVVDGLAVNTEGEKYTVYLVLLRAVKGNKAVVMEPLIKRGCEKEDGWREAILGLSEDDRRRIKGLISDGFRTLKIIARENNWIYQRCHFHLLKMLQSMRGGRFRSVKHKYLRERMYQLTRIILIEKDGGEAQRLIKHLNKLSRSSNCPKFYGRRIRGFLREVDDFRTYLSYSNLNLPATSNSAECAVGLIKETIRNTRGFKTAKSLDLWIRVRVRSLRKIECNGKIFTQN